MNKIIFDILMIIIICIFVLGYAFIISLLIVDIIIKYKKKKQKFKEEKETKEYKRKHSGHYRIMAPKLDSIDKACYDLTPELYYTYGIGMDFKHIMARFRRGTAFNLLPSAKCYFVEMTQDEYDEFEIKYRIDPDLIQVPCIAAPTSTVLSSIKLIEEILKLPKNEYNKFINKYHITSQDLDIAYKKLIKRRG